MSEAIDYFVFVKFKTKEAADRFAEHDNVTGFFDDVDEGFEENSIELTMNGGWRGAGKTCLEILKEEIGAVLEEFRDDIVDFNASATYIENPPMDEYKLEDFVGKPIEAQE